MKFFETKNIAKTLIILFALFFVLPFLSSATEYSSGSFTVLDPVVDEGGQSSSSLNFGLGQSIGQTAIGKSASASFQLWSGFQYFFTVKANTLTATPGDAEVDLSWTIPQTYLGVLVGSYEVGVGTISGSYTFSNVGNVTSYTQTGLTNGTPYFFIIKALTAGGTFLVFSNEATATPNGAPPPGGGGGGGGGNASIVFNGYGYPNSSVTLVKGSQISQTVTASNTGAFTITLNNQNSGNYSYSLYGTDATGNKSSNLNITATLGSNTTKTLNNLIIPPTISASHITIKQGDSISIRGFTGPSSAVTLNFTGQQNFSQNVTSDASGYYSFTLNTTNYKKGNYNVTAIANVFGFNSPASKTVNFAISEASVVTPTGDCMRSDLNCDGRVELIDFSILLYFWDSANFSKNPRVDIDKSGRVGLRDLSIMLYDWTG